MSSLVENSIGILPAGALGVSFFYHLTHQLQNLDRQIYFLARQNSGSAIALRKKGKILIADGQSIHPLATNIWLKPDVLTCYQSGFLPEVLLICTNPDQLLEIISSIIDLLVLISERGQLENITRSMPLFVLCSNGIYFQRFRQIFIEKLEEATLFGHLPDLWPNLMPSIVCRLLRGVTIQTGVREGHGIDTIYRPGPSGKTVITGGDSQTRERCHQILVGRGAWFENGLSTSATRLEFDKALANLACNLLGQIHGIDDQGNFKTLTVGDIVNTNHQSEIRELVNQVFQVGQKLKVYGLDEDVAEIFNQLLETCRPHHAHIPSSLQWVDIKLRLNQLEPKITPTESWLIEPLMRYAKASGLEESSQYFQSLKEQLIRKLTLAIQKSGSDKLQDASVVQKT